MRDRLRETLEGGEPDATPIWLMRQSGRYLPGYRKLRKNHGILDIVMNPRLALEATLEPVKLFDVDAGIVFSDIVVPFLGIGVKFRITPGAGPVVTSPVRTESALEELSPFDAEKHTGFVGKTIELFHEASDKPIIGFAAAPFTLACYLIEGSYRRDFPQVRALLGSSSGLFMKMMNSLSDVTLSYLRMQQRKGADVIQLFDTWVGILSPSQFRALVLPHVKKIVTGLERPVIYFTTASTHLLPDMASMGAAGISVDWRTPLSTVRKILGDRIVLQGNLDPAALLSSREVMERMAFDVLKEHPERGGHIFNIGHGILPETEPQRVKELVELVHHHGKER